jgi:hypothetical protein
MKTFEDICKMTQKEVKAYMKSYLISHKYEVVDEDGFLYAKGTVPVLLVAHMDTVHKAKCKTIVNDNGKLSSPQGIGGDDRCGVFIIMNLVKEFNCSVLLCEDEEKGGIGADKFVNATYQRTDDKNNIIKEKYIEHLDVNYMIEFDRKGSNDAVFYRCDNKEFNDFVEDMTGFKTATGTFSDISTLMPAAKLAGVNLSCGYYNAHQTNEYVVYDEMMDTIEAVKPLIKEKCDKPFEFVPRKYTPIANYSYYSYRSTQPNYTPRNYWDDGYNYSGNMFDEPSPYKDERLANIAQNDLDLELEVVVLGLDMCEETLIATGETKAECWMNLFLENPRLCFNDIQDYSWG